MRESTAINHVTNRLVSPLFGPADNAAAVTPSDGSDLANFSRALFVGGAGAVKVDMVGGTTAVTLTGVVAGTVLPMRVSRVYSTGTTATNIVALY
jgi:hypothetical protein